MEVRKHKFENIKERVTEILFKKELLNFFQSSFIRENASNRRLEEEKNAIGCNEEMILKVAKKRKPTQE